MGRTTFTNASGLPDPDQWTTAHDLAILSRRLINDFPGYYRYFSTPSFAWHRQIIFNHDNMLRTYPGADGLKTGYTDASGHNLVTSAVHSGVRLIGVVLGAATNGERDIHMASLLDHGFEQMDVPVFHKPILVATRMTLVASAHAAEVVRPVPPHARNARWAVRVGYPPEPATHGALAVRREAETRARVEPSKLHGKTILRSKATGLTHADEQETCSGHHKKGCMRGQVASR